MLGAKSGSSNQEDQHGVVTMTHGEILELECICENEALFINKISYESSYLGRMWAKEKMKLLLCNLNSSRIQESALMSRVKDVQGEANFLRAELGEMENARNILNAELTGRIEQIQAASRRVTDLETELQAAKGQVVGWAAVNELTTTAARQSQQVILDAINTASERTIESINAAAQNGNRSIIIVDKARDILQMQNLSETEVIGELTKLLLPQNG